MPTAQQTKRVPADAFNLALGRCEFAAPPAGEAAAAPTRGPIKLKASSGEPFNARYWGPLVIDFAGVTWAKDRLTLDYCHNDLDIIGYADTIDTASGAVTVSGELVSAFAGDRAQEVLIKGQNGVPYEASLKIDPRNGLVVEEFQAGTFATVNGKQFAGPVTVFRKSLLRGVAVCPYGADPYTQTEFSHQEGGEVAVSVFSQEPDAMPETKPAEQPSAAEAQAVAREAARTEFKTLVDGYTALCLGDVAFATAAAIAGKDVPTVAGEFITKLKAGHDATVAELTAKAETATAKVTELEERLASLSLGEQKAASSTPAEGAKNDAIKKYAGHLPPGLAAFAAKIDEQMGK